jgi:mycothiol system anti-sigma-R factor
MSTDSKEPLNAEPTPAECVDYLERIVALIDNELPGGDCAAVREHLDTCSPCLASYDIQVTVKRVVARSCTEVAPGELRSKVLLKLQQMKVQISDSGSGLGD